MSENKKDLLLDEELETEFDELEEQVDEVEIIELTDDKGNILKFFLVGETAYNGKEYAFFMPAQEIDGLGEGEVVVFEKGEKVDGKEELLPIEDHVLLENVYEQFCREMEESVDALEAEELEGGCCCGHHHHHEDDEECECGHHHEEGEECCCGHHHEEGEECCDHHHHHHHEHGEHGEKCDCGCHGEKKGNGGCKKGKKE